MFDPPVYCSASSTISALKFSVARGYHHYVCGRVPADRALALAARFHERYDLPQTLGERERKRRAGRARFRLFFWPRENSLDLDWWLLRTDGTHPLLCMESWRDARTDRLEWTWWFELVRLPVDPALREKYRLPDGSYRINSHTWTWRISGTETERLRAVVRHAAQYHDDRLPQLIRSLQCCPGERGIRGDVFRLYLYIQSQCKRRKKIPPSIPPTIRWSTGKRGASIPLSSLVARAQRGSERWFPEARGSTSKDTDTVFENPTTRSTS